MIGRRRLAVPLAHPAATIGQPLSTVHGPWSMELGPWTIDRLGNGPAVGAPRVFYCIDHHNSYISTNDDSIEDLSVRNIHIDTISWLAPFAELSYTIA